MVSLVFAATGDVSSYMPSVVSDLRLKFAETARVDTDVVIVNVRSGSVVISVDISTESSSMSHAVQLALAPSVATAFALTTLLSSIPGITITVSAITEPLSISTVSSPPPAMPSSSGLSIGALLGIIVGGFVCAILLVFVFYKSVINIQNSPSHAPLTPRIIKGMGHGVNSHAGQGNGRELVEITASVKHGNMDII